MQLTPRKRVRILPHPFWPDGAVGTIQPYPDFAAELCGGVEGCFRVVQGAHGPIVFYWVIFDKPASDGDGDDFYGEGEIMEEYLLALND